MPTTHRIPQLAVAFALVFTSLAGVTPASASVRDQDANPAVAVPVSEYNARWPREPASGPLPPFVSVPAAASAEPRNHVAVPVLAGLLLLAVCTGAVTGLRLRPRVRRRVAA